LCNEFHFLDKFKAALPTTKRIAEEDTIEKVHIASAFALMKNNIKVILKLDNTGRGFKSSVSPNLLNIVDNVCNSVMSSSI